jgi:hypothetical protein
MFDIRNEDYKILKLKIFFAILTNLKFFSDCKIKLCEEYIVNF